VLKERIEYLKNQGDQMNQRETYQKETNQEDQRANQGRMEMEVVVGEWKVEDCRQRPKPSD
jgi:hypothetical protein